MKIRSTIRRMRYLLHFWLAKQVKNGVVYLRDCDTLEEAYDRVRKGGYIIVG